jgi:hypothetical protein
MPQRFLRPGITTSERWNAVSFEAQSLFIRILTIVDDFGRCDARIPVLHGQCFALRDDIKPLRTAALRSELQRALLIEVYAVSGREYLQITQWQERARSERSKFPDPLQVVDISTSAANGSGPQDSAASIVPRPSFLDHRSSTIATASKRVAFATPSDPEVFLLFEKTGGPRTEAIKFLNHYHSNGWKVGRNPMRSLPHAVGNWVARWREKQQPSGGIRENIKPKITIIGDEQ